MDNWSTKKLVIQGLEGFILLGYYPLFTHLQSFSLPFLSLSTTKHKKIPKKG